MRNLLTLVLIAISFFSFGQKSEKFRLNWKVGPGDTLNYLTIMNQIDTSSTEMNYGGLFEAISDSTNGKVNFDKFFKKINDVFDNSEYISQLTSTQSNVVDIVLLLNPKPKTEKNETDTLDEKAVRMAEMTKMMQSMNSGVMLRGSVYKDGGVHSFWNKQDQKNLVALFFELPSHPVAVGDSWELEVNLIAFDQNFDCDSAYKKNEVTLIDVKQIDGETIAVVKYEIEEFATGTFNMPSLMGGGPKETYMRCTYQAVAEFSMDKGRWISNNGIMSLESKGMMNTNVKKKFALVAQ